MRCSWGSVLLQLSVVVLVAFHIGMAAEYPDSCNAGDDMKIDGNIYRNASGTLEIVGYSYWQSSGGDVRIEGGMGMLGPGAVIIATPDYSTPENIYLRPGSGAVLGKVEVGTSSVPNDVKAYGDVECDTVRANVVKIGNWTIEAPDYVFEHDYDLRPLDQVAEYVTENKHLPEVPSAQDMKQNGVDLAEMNMALLKKVEELTLYAIDQEKRLSELEAALRSRSSD